MQLELVLGDITAQQVEALVNVANSSLLGGGGVDGAIHRRGAPEILAGCRALRAGKYRDGLPSGGHRCGQPAGPLGDPYRRAGLRRARGPELAVASRC